MELLERGQLAQSGEFILRVKVAMLRAASALAAAADSGKVAYDISQRYAVQVLNNPDSKVNAFAYAVAAAPGITATATDSDIEFTVNSMFNLFAGVTPAQVIKDKILV